MDDFTNDFTREEIEALEKEVERNPDDAVAWADLGFCYGNLGDHQQASTALQKAVELDPSLASVWANLGGSYASLGNCQQATDALR
ncbi:MAG: tetratricopeptide repeat protein, partial [Anaerolineales bacterium]|nr:tetratricopeptide repeat protein [Anaerolineales bacterium]